jgi:DnaJ-class molecular chaperone
MKNPYKILNLQQDASKSEIMKAVMVAMKNRKYSLRDIHQAQNQLLNPEKRLAADFLFPAKLKSRRLKKIKCDIPLDNISVNSLNANVFDSLK